MHFADDVGRFSNMSGREDDSDANDEIGGRQDDSSGRSIHKPVDMPGPKMRKKRLISDDSTVSNFVFRKKKKN